MIFMKNCIADVDISLNRMLTSVNIGSAVGWV